MTGSEQVSIDAGELSALVTGIFTSVGLDGKSSKTVANALVEADLEGQHSHGVMLVDLYVKRIIQGSVTCRPTAEIVHDNDAILVLDAHNGLGHLSGDQAMGQAVERAKQFGVGIAAVRNGFHFGTARRFAIAAADLNCIGIAMCNTRPLMPAPGGADKMVGNNPLAIALPSDGATPLVLDMAMSEAAMGKIRLAAAIDEPIPDNWAADVDGRPTTNATSALDGMLLPAAGPKGFGLAFMIDLMCGLLSGGGWGDQVTPLYGDFAKAYNCSHLFIAIDVSHFGEAEVFTKTALQAAERIRNSAKAPGVERVYAPGEPEQARRDEAHGRVRLGQPTCEMLARIAGEFNISLNGMEDLFNRS